MHHCRLGCYPCNFSHLDGDLKIWIQTPSGGLVGLVSKTGNDDDTGCSTGSTTDLMASIPIIFDDDSANDPEDMGTLYPGTTTFFSSGALPENVAGQCGGSPASPATTLTLTDLNGGDATGTWTLFLTDNAQLDTGDIESASFDFVCA